MMKHTHLNLFTIIILMVISSLGIHAQTTLTIGDDEVLIYVKWVDEDGQWMYVIWHGSEMSTYQPADDECMTLSPDGRYLAWSTEDAETLKIFDFSTMELLYQQDWDETWKPCHIIWWSTNTMLFVNNETDLFSAEFRFENLTLTELSILSYQTPIFPTLPSFYPESKNNFILQNPANPNIYLYERCLKNNIDMDGFCRLSATDTIETDIVIYDLSTNEDLEILNVRNGDFMRGYDTAIHPYFHQHISSQLVSWSPDGRYLSYFDAFAYFDIIYGRLKIYDLQTDTYFNDVEGLYTINLEKSFRYLWLSNTTFVIWHTDSFWESTRIDGDEVLFAFAHADTQTYTSSQQPFKVIATHYAPDGNGMLFIGKPIDPRDGVFLENDPRRGDLFYMSATTGEYTMIDQDVVSIITWRTLEEGEEWGE